MTGGAADAGAAARSSAKAPKITDLVIGSPPWAQCLTHTCTRTFHKTLDEEGGKERPTGVTVHTRVLVLAAGRRLGTPGEVSEISDEMLLSFQDLGKTSRPPS